MTAPIDARAARLAEIEARLDAATPGPWAHGKMAASIVSTAPEAEPRQMIGEQEREYYGGILVAESAGIEDVELIRAAPDDVRYLLDEVASLTAQLAAAREGLRGICDYGWTYDGRTTYSINVVSRKDAARLQAAIEASVDAARASAATRGGEGEG